MQALLSSLPDATETILFIQQRIMPFNELIAIILHSFIQQLNKAERLAFGFKLYKECTESLVNWVYFECLISTTI